jgi:hypothetical protein
MRLSPTTAITQDPGPVSTVVDGEVLMMSADSGTYFGLNAVGSRIWELAARPITVRELCDRLREEYDVFAEQCEGEVLGYLEQLLDRGLIRVCDAPAA